MKTIVFHLTHTDTNGNLRTETRHWQDREHSVQKLLDIMLRKHHLHRPRLVNKRYELDRTVYHYHADPADA